MARNDLTSHFKNQILRLEWQGFWEGGNKENPVHYFQLHPLINNYNWLKEQQNISRRCFITTTKLKINHRRNPVHLHRIGLS